jgi:hypothetical protein
MCVCDIVAEDSVGSERDQVQHLQIDGFGSVMRSRLP